MNYNTTYFIDTYIDNMFFSRSESFLNKELCKVKFRHLSNSLNTTNPHKSPYFSLKIKVLVDLDEYEKYAPRSSILKSPFTHKLPVVTPLNTKHSVSNVNTGASFVMSNLKPPSSPVVSKTTTTSTSSTRSELKCLTTGINPFGFGFLPAAAKDMIVKQQEKSRKENEKRERTIEMAKFLGRQFMPKNAGITTNIETPINSTINFSSTESEDNDSDNESVTSINYNEQSKNKKNSCGSKSSSISSEGSEGSSSSSGSKSSSISSEGSEGSSSSGSKSSSISSEGSSSSGSKSSSISSEGSYISSDVSGDEVNSTNPSFMNMAASLFVSQTST